MAIYPELDFRPSPSLADGDASAYATATETPSKETPLQRSSEMQDDKSQTAKLPRMLLTMEVPELLAMFRARRESLRGKADSESAQRVEKLDAAIAQLVAKLDEFSERLNLPALSQGKSSAE